MDSPWKSANLQEVQKLGWPFRVAPSWARGLCLYAIVWISCSTWVASGWGITLGEELSLAKGICVGDSYTPRSWEVSPSLSKGSQVRHYSPYQSGRQALKRAKLQSSLDCSDIMPKRRKMTTDALFSPVASCLWASLLPCILLACVPPTEATRTASLTSLEAPLIWPTDRVWHICKDQF